MLYKFRVLGGSHQDVQGRNYEKGDEIVTDDRLDKKFVNKFLLLETFQDADVPAPARPAIPVPVVAQAKVEKVEEEVEEEEDEPVLDDEDEPVEPVKKKKKTTKKAPEVKKSKKKGKKKDKTDVSSLFNVEEEMGVAVRTTPGSGEFFVIDLNDGQTLNEEPLAEDEVNDFLNDLEFEEED